MGTCNSNSKGNSASGNSGVEQRNAALAQAERARASMVREAESYASKLNERASKWSLPDEPIKLATSAQKEAYHSLENGEKPSNLGRIPYKNLNQIKMKLRQEYKSNTEGLSQNTYEPDGRLFKAYKERVEDISKGLGHVESAINQKIKNYGKKKGIK